MDHGHIRNVEEIEIAHLILRYAHTRLHRPEMLSSLVGSIARCGQIIPVITLKEAPDCFVLLDGYLRVEALTRCGRDTVVAEIWQCREEEALIEVLARGHTRRWDVIEEAALLRELHHRSHLSQAQIASMLGRKQGWVSGRLALYDALPEELLALIHKGRISTWAATRILAPIARAIPEHATRLTENLLREDIPTRDLAVWFRHYQRANRRQRENMVLQPALFLKALRMREEDEQAISLKEGPEGTWLKDLKVAGHILRRLIKGLPTVLYQGQSTVERRTVVKAFEDTKRHFLILEKDIRRIYDTTRDHTGHCEPASTGDHNQTDQSAPHYLEEHGPTSASGTVARCAGEDFSLRATHPPAA
jgi:ParB-like chromosome segregation protein Spo0J